jgi:hypothetical protein
MMQEQRGFLLHQDTDKKFGNGVVIRHSEQLTESQGKEGVDMHRSKQDVLIGSNQKFMLHLAPCERTALADR